MAAEQFLNGPQTTLSGSLSSGSTSFGVASSSGFPSGTTQFRVQIDSELISVTNVSGTTWTVTRGMEGTTPASHSSGAAVTSVLTAGALGAFAETAAANTFATTQTVNTGAAGNKGLVVQGFASQTANLQEWQDSSGAVLADIDGDGVPNFPDGSNQYTQRVGLNSAASGNWSAAFGRSATANAPDGGATAIGGISSANYDYSTALGTGATASATGATAIGGSTLASGENSFSLGRGNIASHAATTSMGYGISSTESYEFRFGTGYGYLSSAPVFHLVGVTTTTGNLELLEVRTSWVDATYATRKARVTFSTYDTAAREAFRIEANGSAAMIGFFGASAVTQPTSSDALDTLL